MKTVSIRDEFEKFNSNNLERLDEILKVLPEEIDKYSLVRNEEQFKNLIFKQESNALDTILDIYSGDVEQHLRKIKGNFIVVRVVKRNLLRPPYNESHLIIYERDWRI